MKTAAFGHIAPKRWTMVALALATAATVLLVGANAHLVYVAVASQPACVPHAKEIGGAKFRAARSSC